MADASTSPAPDGDRLAKVIARSGLCSRRDAEKWIAEGRVSVDGKVIRTPAFNVTANEKILVDNEPLAERRGTRVWLYHKPAGLVVTEKDPEGRTTIFETLETQGLPRVVSVGRLDINTEGLLLLTNDGGLKRVLELPSTGWLRKYRVRAHGTIDQKKLDTLKTGVEVDGIKYGPIEASLERVQASNVWLIVALREGKNREVKNVLGALGLQVNRLIRISFGPFQLGDLPIGGISLVKSRVLRDQLGSKLAAEAGADFDSAFPEEEEGPKPTNPNARLRQRIKIDPAAAESAAAKPAPKPRGRTGEPVHARSRAAASSGASARNNRDSVASARGQKDNYAPARNSRDKGASVRNSRDSGPPARSGRPADRGAFGTKFDPAEEAPLRTVHFDDGRESEQFQPRARRPRGDAGGSAAKGPRKFGAAPRRADDRGPQRPARDGGDRSRAPRPPRDGDDKPRYSRPGEKREPSRPARASEQRPRMDRADTGKPRSARPERSGDAPRPARSGPRKPSGPGASPKKGPPRKGPPRGKA